MENLSDSFDGKNNIILRKLTENFPNHHPDPSEPKNLRCQKKF